MPCRPSYRHRNLLGALSLLYHIALLQDFPGQVMPGASQVRAECLERCLVVDTDRG